MRPISAAITIVPGHLSGQGIAAAIDLHWHAKWTPDDPEIRGAPDSAVIDAVRAHLQLPPCGVTIEPPVPHSCGLKTSSAAASALLQAGRLALKQKPLTSDQLIATSIAICKEAKVTITGAVDDQAAVVLGGIRLGDVRRNVHRELQLNLPSAVAIWIPCSGIAKSAIPQIIPGDLERLAKRAITAFCSNDLTTAKKLPPELAYATAAWYEANDISINLQAMQVALENGAWTAGISGTGPAIMALFDEPVNLPEISGGEWLWTSLS